MAYEDEAEVFQIEPDIDSVADPKVDDADDIDSRDSESDFVYDDEDVNLVEVFRSHPRGKEALRRIVNQVVDDYDSVYDGTSEYRERRAKNWKIFAGDLPPKSYPFEDSANCHVPILIEAFSRTHSQMSSEIFGNWTNFVGVRGTGPDDKDQADAMSMHLNWQFTEDIEDFPRQMSRGIMEYLWGDVSAVSFWDRSRERFRHVVLTPDQLFVPYTQTSTMSDYSDCPYVCMVRSYHRHELESEEEWHGVDKLISKHGSSWEDDPEDLIGLSISETIGIDRPMDEHGAAPYKILHYEGWDRGILPGQSRSRYIQAIVDHKSRTILKLHVHEDYDWKDQVKYKREFSEFLAYTVELERYNRAIASADRFAAIRGGGDSGLSLAADPFTPAFVGTPGVPDPAESAMPVRPRWMGEGKVMGPEKPRLKPVHMFTHAVCIEPMAGTIGIGYLDQVADYNRGANTVLSQYTDAATLSNCSTFLAASGLEIDDNFSLAPGKWNTIQGATAAGNEIFTGIKELKTQPANPQMLELVSVFKSYAEGAMQSNPVLSGDPGKSGETWRGHAARLEAATKQLSVRAQTWTNNFLKHIYRNQCRLNSIYLPEYELLSLLDWKTQRMAQVDITREMYLRDYNVTIRADLRFSSESQRVQEATELMAIARENPIMAPNLAFQHAVAVKLLEARRDHDLVPLLGDAPPPGTPQPQPEQAPPPAAGAAQQG